MAKNIANMYFDPLEETGENYQVWEGRAVAKLKAKGLHYTLANSFQINETDEDMVKDANEALSLIQQHIAPTLLKTHIKTTNPSELWKKLKDTFDNQKEILAPDAEDAWSALKFSNFKTP